MEERWWERGECHRLDPDVYLPLFFPRADDLVTIAKARSICYQCRVRDDCLAYAYAHNVQDGIWGGKFFERTVKTRKTRCPKCASTDLFPWGNTVECVTCKHSWPR